MSVKPPSGSHLAGEVLRRSIDPALNDDLKAALGKHLTKKGIPSIDIQEILNSAGGSPGEVLRNNEPHIRALIDDFMAHYRVDTQIDQTLASPLKNEMGKLSLGNKSFEAYRGQVGDSPRPGYTEWAPRTGPTGIFVRLDQLTAINSATKNAMENGTVKFTFSAD